MLQIKTFDNVTGNPEEEANNFLKGIEDSLIKEIHPVYNTIMGGMMYVIEYYEVKKNFKP